MAHNQPSQGFGSIHTTTTQNPTLSSSLLNTAFVPTTTATESANRQTKKSKSYPCTWPGCTQLFSCPHNVQQHIREKHTLEKPYVCDTCASDGTYSAFSRPYGLNRHMKQVHYVGVEPSSAVTSLTADELEVDDVSQWTGSSQAVEGAFAHMGEFAEMGALLGRANAVMGDVSSNVEISGVQSQFDAELPDANVSGLRNSGSIACGECGYAATRHEEILTHMHTAHGAPNTRFCACNICTLMFVPSEEEAMNQAIMLADGALHTHQDASFRQEGPNVTMAPDWSSQPDASNAIGFSNIDPALLSFSYT